MQAFVNPAAIEVAHGVDEVIVALRGNFDASMQAQVLSLIRAQRRDLRRRQLVFDVRNLGQIDTTGLCVLAQGGDLAAGGRTPAVLRHVSNVLRQQLFDSGLGGIFQLEP